jgi:hypothetical protein
MGMFAETAIVDYRYHLLTKENKCLFSVSVCKKQTEVFHFHFPLAENKRKWPFSVCGIPEKRRLGHMETETRKHGDMGKWRQGDRETWKHPTEN